MQKKELVRGINLLHLILMYKGILFSSAPANQWRIASENFLENLNQEVDKHLDDPELNIMQLADKMGMCRTSLFRKVKSATGLSPSMYICSRRLSIACLMLRQTDLPVSQIAYSLGFTSPSYFTRMFRARYDISPTAFRQAGQYP